MSSEHQVLFIGGSMNRKVACCTFDSVPFEKRIPNCVLTYRGSNSLVPVSEWDEQYIVEYFFHNDKAYLVGKIINDKADDHEIHSMIDEFKEILPFLHV